MVERYVFIKLRQEHASDAGRAEVAERSRALASIAGVTSVRVGLPADEAASGSWDVSIVLSFEKLEDIEPYRTHPDHRSFVDEFLAPRMEVIKAWNFQV